MTTQSTGHQLLCQICRKAGLIELLNLGHQPIVQEYVSSGELKQQETVYPLALVRCRACGLLQLDYIVEPKKVFHQEYPYRTGLTNMLLRNFEQLADGMHGQKMFGKGDLVVDIGSNDGTLLKPFKARGARVVGIEPTNAAKDARKAGVPTLQEFFSPGSVRAILKKHGKARVITAANVFAHINDAPALMRNIRTLMGTGSVFVSES